MYKDYFLRCESAETMRAKLLEAGILVVQDGELTPTVALYCVGVIHEPTGALLVDADGNNYPKYAPIEGYHVNIRGNLTQGQIDILPIIPRPKNPKAVFAS